MENTLVKIKEFIETYQRNKELFDGFDQEYFEQKKSEVEIELKQLAIQLLSELRHVPTLTEHVNMQVVSENLNNDLNALNN